jgi:hypothetical protein
MLCVNVTRAGEITPVTPQPDNITECALVIPSGGYVAGSPFYMTREQGTAIGLAIASVWVVVGIVRMVARRLT